MRLRGMPPTHARSLWRSVRAHGFTITALARHAARIHGDRLGLVVDGWSSTFRQLWRSAEGVAAVLYLGPLERRPRPVVLACRGPAMQVALLAAARLGLDVMPVSPRSLDDYARAVPRDALLIHDGDAPDWHPGPAVSAEQVMEWSSSDGSGLARTRHRARIVLPSETAAGTITRHVQGAMGLQGLRQLAGLHDRLGLEGTDVVLVCAPPHRGQGLQMLGMALLTGATLVSAAHTSPADRIRIIRDRFVSVLSASPRQLQGILDELDRSGEEPPRLRRIMVAGEDIGADLVRRLHATWGPIVLAAYGTVQTGTVAVATPEVLSAHPDTAGRRLPGSDFGIVGHSGRGDAHGLLWVRGAHATVITEDQARIDDGRLTIVGTLSRPDTAD
ncbi:Acyl-CoA synthetase (AMP-forming)/AMP-acid ligase II [Agrococcus carbonis]|uniref:Acyl-CoA synthetase (AMP-forming)/AMP-acid ligase II n=2 Tax=Agrococcus carbonis TaxID=684552 RepID=A0A1H1LA89_9MICO|nr:Acyl-CoA synthetase (AMP-forming)/AMP-acid ligase II [Agrococcus carbonis]